MLKSVSITGDEMKKVIFFLSLVLIVSCLSSCSIDNSAVLDELMNAATENETDNKYQYSIILPENASPSLIGAAEILSRELTEHTGIVSALKYDGVSYPENDLEIKIYFGYSDTDIAIYAMRYFRQDDYFCGRVDDSYVIGGKTDDATANALEAFLSDLLPRLESGNILDLNDSILFKDEYAIKSSYLNGYLLEEYSIVYDESVSENEAEFLSRVICERSGYLLDVCAEKDFHERYGGRAIYISADTARYGHTLSDQGYIINNNEEIIVFSEDRYRRYSAMDKLCGLLFENMNEERETHLSIADEIWVNTEVSDITYASYEGDSNASEHAFFLSGVLDKLNNYDIDVMLLTAHDDTDIQIACTSLPHGYSAFYTFSALDTYCAVLYRNDRMKGEKASAFSNDGNMTVMCEFSNLNNGEKVAFVYSFGDVGKLTELDVDEDSILVCELRTQDHNYSADRIEGYNIEFSMENTIGSKRSTVTRYVSEKFYARNSFQNRTGDVGASPQAYRSNFAYGEYRKEYIE